MNKVITINLGGNAFPLEEGGYEALQAYLATAARRLERNPDRAEIIADIEQAIADKFRAVLSAHKGVVLTAEVATIITEMGAVEDGSPQAEVPGGAAAPTTEAGPSPAGEAPVPRRLYKIREGAELAGVCNGLAAFSGLDIRLVRMFFVIFTAITCGFGLLLYVGLALVLPTALTPAEKSAATGAPSTTEEFIRRAREGYYAGMRTMGDKQAHRAWRRKFKREMRAWRHDFRREMRSRRWARTEDAPPGADRPGPYVYAHPAATIARPVISLVIGLIFLLAIWAAWSLLTSGAVWGWPLPDHTPLWIGLVLLAIAYHILVWPLKILRYFCYFPGSDRAVWRLHHDSSGGFVGLACLLLVLWYAHGHIPAVHRAIDSLPPLIHHTVDAVRAWWARR